MTKQQFKTFKRGVLDLIDSNLGFIPNMEIDLVGETPHLFLKEKLIYVQEKEFAVEQDAVTDFFAEVSSLTENLLTDKREEEAVDLIRQAVLKHGNKLISGYSGGKDSKVILHLARRANPNIVPVHNSHPEEKCDLTAGVVIIKEPKTNFTEYLKYVDVTAQLDGTRVAEEGKTVIVNGKEIERGEMTEKDVHNPSGVFGLEFYYPILFWTDEMVWDYIEKYKLMSAFKISTYVPSRPYRGEGTYVTAKK